MLGTSSPLKGLEEATDRLIRLPVPEADTPDVVGRVRHVIRRLGEWTRGLLAEAAPCEGTDYDLVESRHAERSYNTPRLLGDCAEALGLDLARGVSALVGLGVVKVEWRWTELSRFAAVHNLTLEVAKRETGEDLDSPHVGEVWRSRMDVRGKEGT
jgi:hypothetical protein